MQDDRTWLFDVDGTLTPSRAKIVPEMEEFMIRFCTSHRAYAVTGSDREKTLEQLGSNLYCALDGVFQCNGGQLWRQQSLEWEMPWTIPLEAERWLMSRIDRSRWTHRSPPHLEHRVGMCNFSILGRGTRDLDEREAYVQHDRLYRERAQLAAAFNRLFPSLEASLGGETGIDISPRGWTKARVLDYVDLPVIFLGDSMSGSGNDAPLCNRILGTQSGECFEVHSWVQTRERCLYA